MTSSGLHKGRNRESRCRVGQDTGDAAPAGPGPTADDLMFAAENMDWRQVIMNGGPPCFRLCEDGRFCGRAERWDGHGSSHSFVPLSEMLKGMAEAAARSSGDEPSPEWSADLLPAALALHARAHEACPFITLQTGPYQEGIVLKMKFKEYDGAAAVHSALVRLFSATVGDGR